MFELPTEVTVNGRVYPIRNKGDYRMVLDCFLTLHDTLLDSKERIITTLIIFYSDFNSIEDVLENPDLKELVEEMYSFFNCGQKNPGKKTNYRLIDWEKDEQLIASAVNSVAGKEVRAEAYIHWYTFMGYYTAIGESSLSTVVGIRQKIVKGKKLEKYEAEFQRDNPEYFDWNFKTSEQEELEAQIKALWNHQ